MRQPGIKPQLRPQLYDIRFRQPDQRRMRFDASPSLYRRLGGEVRHALERFDIFGTSVGISGVIERIHADEDVRGFEDLGPGQREGKKNRIARRDIGDGNLPAHLLRRAPLWDRDIAGQSGMSELAQIEAYDPVLDGPETGGHPRGAFELDAVPLAVVERERVAVETVAPRQSQTSRGIQASAQQTHGLHLGSFKASRNPITGVSTRPVKAYCME